MAQPDICQTIAHPEWVNDLGNFSGLPGPSPWTTPPDDWQSVERIMAEISVFEGHFRSMAERFTWFDGVNPLDVESERTTFALGPQDTENQTESSLPYIRPKPGSCTFGQLRSTIEGRHTWNHYNREYVPLRGFKALVRLRFDHQTLFECDGFENRQEAKAYCEALVTGDHEEVIRLEQVAVEDQAHRGEDEYNWIDSVGYSLDDVEREAALTPVTVIEAGLEELAQAPNERKYNSPGILGRCY